MDLEVWKSGVELISSIFFLIAAVIGAFAFKYKYDSNIRDLYIENYKKIREIIKDICGRGYVSLEMVNLMKEASQEADLFLHKDVIKFVDKVSETVGIILVYKNKSEQKSIKAEIELGDLYNQATRVYRKHIIQDIKEKLKYKIEELIDSSSILNWFKCKPTRTG